MAFDPRNQKYENMSTSGAEDEEPKKKRFNFFDRFYGKDGPGVDEDELKVLEDPSLKNFFKLLRRKLWRIVYTNLFYVVGFLPLIAMLVAYFFLLPQSYVFSPESRMYANVYANAALAPSPLAASLVGVYGRISAVPVDSTAATVLLILTPIVGGLFFGMTNVGCTRILRSMVREEPIFLRQDFFETIKKNIRQALVFGVIDCTICFVLVLDVKWLNETSAAMGGMMTAMLIAVWGIMIIYSIMRMYIYLMMITFDLKITKLIKNAFLFTALGIKRNVLAFFGCVILFIVPIALFGNFYTIPLGIFILLFLSFGLSAFMGAYAAYPKIKEVMIDPYYDADGNPKKVSKTSASEA